MLERSLTDHRPWPVPAGPWIMEQTWHHLLFAHWPVPPEALRAVVPAALPLDTFAGQAWLGVVAFRLSGVRLRGLPPLPLVSRFPELNLRTYVTLDGKPGVFFLSMDADNRLGIALARPWFHLPYTHARMTFDQDAAGVRVTACRDGAGSAPASFAATYRPAGPVAPTPPGSLARWLTERYCYYCVDRGGRPWRCEIAHPPWPLQPATARIGANTLAAAQGLALAAPSPLLHYARGVRAVIWPVRRVVRAYGVGVRAGVPA